MSERAVATAKKPEAKKTCSNFCRQNTGFNSSGPTVDMILQLQKTAGNRAVQKLIKSEVLQAKLSIGQPNDIYEQEADRVAEQVMRMPEPKLQRQDKKVGEEELIQAKLTVNQITPLVQRQAINSYIQRQKNGQPLSKSALSYFEPRFGVDFSQVRLHNDIRSNIAARNLNAQAFTHQQDIFFGEGKYAPESGEGKRLLAHELTHVIQQTNKRELNSRVQCKPVEIPMRKHHLIPQEINKYRHYRLFARRLVNQNIDIHRFIVNIPDQLHKMIHEGPRGGRWNREIISWFRKNPEFTREQLESQLKNMMKKYNIPGSARTFMRKYGRGTRAGKTSKIRHENRNKRNPGLGKKKEIKLPKFKTKKQVRVERKLRQKAIRNKLRQKAVNKATNELAKKMSRKLARKMALKLVLKFGAKIILKAIPVIGWISLAMDVYDVVQLIRTYEESSGKYPSEDTAKSPSESTDKEQPKAENIKEMSLKKLMPNLEFTKISPDVSEAIMKCGISFDIVDSKISFRDKIIKVASGKIFVIQNFFMDTGTIERLPKTEKTIKELRESNISEEQINLFVKGLAYALKGNLVLIYQIIGESKEVAILFLNQIVPFEKKKAVAAPVIDG